MSERLYLNNQERLRLQRILKQVIPPLLEDHHRSLSFHVARKRLHEFTESLSPISKTKESIEKLIQITESPLLHEREKEEARRTFKDLMDTYGLKELTPSLEIKPQVKGFRVFIFF